VGVRSNAGIDCLVLVFAIGFSSGKSQHLRSESDA
jgi:hypothetical protein